MNDSPIYSCGTTQSASEDADVATDSGCFMAYKDAEGNEQEEPACARCIERFTFNDRQREILQRSLEFVGMLEGFSVAHWQETTAQAGSNDWHWVRHLCSAEEALKNASGLFGFSFAQMRASYGSVHLTIAADVIPPEDRDEALELLGIFSRFQAHLHSRHRSDKGHNIGYDIVGTLDEPHYVGSLNLERAWSLSSKLRGKTMDEIRDALQAELDGTAEEIRANLATFHGGRMPRLSVLETALHNAVSVIQTNSEEWVQRAKESMDSADLIYLAHDIHDEVFVVDELLAMGCRSDDPALNTLGGRDLYRAIDGIRELVDWDECSALKQRMDQAERTWARGNGEEDEVDRRLVRIRQSLGRIGALGDTRRLIDGGLDISEKTGG